MMGHCSDLHEAPMPFAIHPYRRIPVQCSMRWLLKWFALFRIATTERSPPAIS